jgi:hypothetical protein
MIKHRSSKTEFLNYVTKLKAHSRPLLPQGIPTLPNHGQAHQAVE